MDVIGILSVLEDNLCKDVKKIWKWFEREYRSVGVQKFDHPNITFQSGKTDKLEQLRKDFLEIVPEIKPIKIKVDGIGHFNKKAIYLKVKKTSGLMKTNKLINHFLKEYCNELSRFYTPKNWVPHITLAMNDLTEENFEKAWKELKNSKNKFKQKLRNICMVKSYSDGKIKVLKKYKL